MSSSSDFDCSKLLINFTNVPRGTKIVDYFPELKSFVEFTQQQDENIIKIAILTSDADSPFWKLRSDRQIMIEGIFDFLQIGTQNIIGKEFLQKVVEYKHEGVTLCWCAYLQIQYNIDFSDWCITKETYDMLIRESMRARDEAKETIVEYSNWRIRIRNEIRKLGDDLKQIEPKIFRDSKMARPVAMEEIKKIKNYPEKYAKKGELL